MPGRRPQVLVAVIFTIAISFEITSCNSSSHPSATPSSPANSTPTTTVSTTSTSRANTPAKHFQATTTRSASPEYITSNDRVVLLRSGNGIEVVRPDGTPLSTLPFIEGANGIVGPTTPRNSPSSLLLVNTSETTTFVYSVRVVNSPARGVDPAKLTYFLTAWNTADGRQAWETPLLGPTGASSVGPMVDATSDGKWVTVQYAPTDAVPVVIDAVTGKAKPLDFGAYPVGAFIAKYNDPHCLHCGDGSGALIDPTTLIAKSKFENSPGGGIAAATDLAFSPYGVIFENGAKVLRTNGLETGNADTLYIGDIASNRIEKTMSTSGFWPTVDDQGGVVLLRHTGGGLNAYSLATGQALWAQPAVSAVCVATNGQVNAIANNQMVLLDEKTGKQLDYTTESNQCGIVSGAYSLQGSQFIKLVD
jgi:hypothetical protein